MNTQLRKQLFLAVRDIPYRLGTASEDCSCIAKTKLLGELLTRAGLECQIWGSLLDWSKTGMPASLFKLAPTPTVNHIFLKVFIPETKRWVIVDPTWDKRFTGTFPINDWDGLSDTELAYPSDQLKLLGPVNKFEFRNFDPKDEFTSKLNAWYESLAERNI